MSELAKAYDPKQYEDAIRLCEGADDYFLARPESVPEGKPFTIIMPPPNVTGTLHLGHALGTVLQDILIRFQRMRGRKVLWLPGTDHAAIATQSKVEKIEFKKTGKSRFDFGREVFLEKVDAFAQASHDTIVNQVTRMGALADWSREAYTLDADRNLAVNTAFKRLYDLGLLYRGYRVVNWDVVGQTTISDDEVVPVERQATLYTFRYGAAVPIAISTTRPETKVGDTAIAVHPNDERYTQYIGNTFEVEFAGAKLALKVIADEEVDPSFGTGALGVTPAHSATDFDMKERHGLAMVQVIGEDGRMTGAAGKLVAGKTVEEARAAVVEWLREQGLMEKEETVQQQVSTAERTGGIIEPLPKMQWFMAVNKPFTFQASHHRPLAGVNDGDTVTLKGLMRHVVETGQITMVPDYFHKIYFHWIDNLRDWCVSRQIWFGHRVPVWYRGDEVCVSNEEPAGGGWQQDEDTLDTWFSSGLWTFSTLGWPDTSAKDFAEFHPTDVLETGRDILPFWVSRMILMSTALTGEIPFRYVYMHGMVRDGEGRKMSKSLDNIINPLDVADKYGMDAVRLALALGVSPGNDMNLSEEKIAGMRNLVNKLWNIGRFIQQTAGIGVVLEAPTPRTDADRWVLARLANTVERVSVGLDEPRFDFAGAGEALREYTWTDVADWYVEVAKVQAQEESLRDHTHAMLRYLLGVLLRLWHPYAPFITNALWKHACGAPSLLIEAPWPSKGVVGELEEGAKRFEQVQELITALRLLRTTHGVAPQEVVSACLSGAGSELFHNALPLVERLARTKLTFASAMPASPKAASTPVRTWLLELERAPATADQRAAHEQSLRELQPYIAALEAKLATETFLQRAPAAVVAAEREKLAQAQAKRDTLTTLLASSYDHKHKP